MSPYVFTPFSSSGQYCAHSGCRFSMTLLNCQMVPRYLGNNDHNMMTFSDSSCNTMRQKSAIVQTIMARLEMPDDHIRLFKHEVKQFLGLQFVKKSKIFDPEIVERLEKMLNGSEKSTAKALEFMFRFIVDDHKEHIFLLEKLLEANAKEVYEEYTMAHCDEVSKELFISKFYDGRREPVIEHLCSFIRADELALDLRKHFGNVYDYVVNDILELWDADMSELELDFLARRIIRRLPFSPVTAACGDWYYHLLIALRESEWHSLLADLIDPENAATIDLFRAEHQKKQMADTIGMASEETYELSAEDQGFRPQSDFKEYAPLFGLTDEFMKFEMLPPEQIVLREYQQELVEEAVTGKNTIVCAPTGSGKTVVASYIIKDHLQKMANSGKNARVVMMVPTIPLVEQQCTALNVFFRVDYAVNGFCGTETAECRAYSALACHIVVFTPQLFMNMLKSPKRTDRLNISDFTMFVFDECHHCDREHPYKILMDMVHESSATSPQIIGLTASVGVGSSNTSVESCMSHMLKICVNMSAETVSTIRRTKDDLIKHVVPPIDIIERAVRQTDSQFIRRLLALMGELQQLLESDLKRYQTQKHLPGKWAEYQFPSDKQSLNYQCFLGMLGARITAIPGIPNKTRFIKILDILKKYQLALEYNDMLPSRYALKLLQDARNEIRSNTVDETYDVVRAFGEHCDGLLMIKEDNCENKKDILVKLKKILVDQYTQMPESRTIVFVQKRVFAEMMCDYLNRMCSQLPCFKEGNNAGYITSANQSASLGGQSGYLQRQTIENFNHGLLKILVATSVAEEGLDISTCNLIIKYNNTGSEKTLIQRRGRARAKGSKSVLLALDGSIEANEMAAVQKADLMKRVMQHLQSYGDSVLKRMIADKREEIKREKEYEEQFRRQSEQQLKSNKFQLVCIKCNTDLCDSTTIRRLPHGQYGCVDREIWGRVRTNLRSTAKSVHSSIDVAQLCCKNSSCDQIFGFVWEVNDTFIPVLKTNSFVMYPYEARHKGAICDPVRVKRWLDVGKSHFVITDCREADLKSMFEALRAYDKSLYRKYSSTAEAARIFLARKEIDKKKKRVGRQENHKKQGFESDEEEDKKPTYVMNDDSSTDDETRYTVYR
ncbi:hypothetical protein QR680_006120 [Steinernema hermaphroditum]|uniref:RNA helicase n=1 Tax=Steinernema hermaphroditum TaxID=289476 RepID=A0AA39LWK7_9BILA|nr:hypothetical protein QR680_006120 [Steinernema hermaphroditum]